jgi:hypothetical protein
MQHGRLALTGPVAQLHDHLADIEAAYLAPT